MFAAFLCLKNISRLSKPFFTVLAAAAELLADTESN